MIFASRAKLRKTKNWIKNKFFVSFNLESTTEETKAADANKSRASKRGAASQQAKNKSDGSSKSKSPGISSKTEDNGQNLKEKQVATELAINKSIYMKTAQFLIKYNALVVRKK